MSRDPYRILAVTKDADQIELKAAYRLALLKYHPDKGGGKYTVDDINLAYQTLTDSQETSKKDFVPVQFSEIVDLADMEDNGVQWVRKCRCGADGYVLTEADLEANGEADEIAVQCTGCSIWILVQYTVEEE
ncbi:Diphthamide biosynthesis protein 4 [Wickerhamiella sorbophila]|uniref:Diphthamide biosynthesis protein 4 n=1 Tax=Wickerhamiella sorbophila TaxID=45607 RepID=A0A2T0FFZ8_9ASCO|nr:Diphthamide biosynthesis protein 4 [Wickerhamiella sorbophila]PRT53904.1 Diphthamide biosynthesis protein 4 [Wickerhamiella sorbophila]